MKHEHIYHINKYEYERVNRLLSIESLSAMSDQELIDAGANTDQNEGIVSALFDDGSRLEYELCSGQENYYDNVYWVSPDGTQEIYLEPTFDLSDIEFDVDGEEYCLKFRVIGEYST